MRDKITGIIRDALEACFSRGALTRVDVPVIEVETTKDQAHGDYASNLALVLASSLKQNPRHLAQTLVEGIENAGHVIRKVEIAGPGFINFFVADESWRSGLAEIEAQGEAYGSSLIGKGRRVQVEFVSANPTGPLHIGHARGAVVGDVIARILEKSGYSVFREYYINDAGNQMQNLGKSVYLRYAELLGREVDFPETCYQGDYIREIAREILAEEGNIHLDRNDAVPYFTDYAGRIILAGIKGDLAEFGVIFDRYFSERELYEADKVSLLLKALEKEGFVYSDGETLWFKSTALGDQKDRVVVRRSGEPTYFAADIAYHKDKLDRGFDLIIDVWGADHHGYIPRMTAGIQALGKDKNSLKIVLVQLVNLLREGIPVAMSTRSGEFVTMREVIEEVGRDASRYNFLMRRSDSHLDFDLEVAKSQSNENPVYYVQYAHARISSILRLAEERGLALPTYAEVDLRKLSLPEEMRLIKAIVRFPEVLEGAVRTLEPHRLTFYLNELAGEFHSYYNKNRVISSDLPLVGARLYLVAAIRTVIKNGLAILGVSAPERMDKEAGEVTNIDEQI